MNYQKATRLLFAANAISGFSQGISMLAIPWYFARNSEGMYFNHAYAAVTILVLIFGLYAGAWVDRYSRKNNFLVITSVCGILLSIISGIGYYHHYLPDLLIVSVFAITMLNYNVHYPTLYAFAQEITPPESYEKINSHLEIVGQSTSIFSGALAAILLDGGDFMGIHIAPWSIWEIFGFDALTYFIAFVLLWMIPYTMKTKPKDFHEPVFTRIQSGFGFLRKHASVRTFGLFSYAVFAMLLVEIHAVLPNYVKWHLQAPGYVFAVADTIYAVGALGAGMFVRVLFAKTDSRIAVIWLTGIVSCIFFWAFASCSAWILYVISLILGFCNAGIRIVRLSYLFRTVPNEFMGRVGSIFNIANVFTRSVFIWIFSYPFFSTSNQIVWSYFIMSAFLALAFVILLRNFLLNRNN